VLIQQPYLLDIYKSFTVDKQIKSQMLSLW